MWLEAETHAYLDGQWMIPHPDPCEEADNCVFIGDEGRVFFDALVHEEQAPTSDPETDNVVRETAPSPQDGTQAQPTAPVPPAAAMPNRSRARRLVSSTVTIVKDLSSHIVPEMPIAPWERTWAWLRQGCPVLPTVGIPSTAGFWQRIATPVVRGFGAAVVAETKRVSVESLENMRGRVKKIEKFSFTSTDFSALLCLAGTFWFDVRSQAKTQATWRMLSKLLPFAALPVVGEGLFQDMAKALKGNELNLEIQLEALNMLVASDDTPRASSVVETIKGVISTLSKCGRIESLRQREAQALKLKEWQARKDAKIARQRAEHKQAMRERRARLARRAGDFSASESSGSDSEESEDDDPRPEVEYDPPPDSAMPVNPTLTGAFVGLALMVYSWRRNSFLGTVSELERKIFSRQYVSGEVLGQYFNCLCREAKQAAKHGIVPPPFVDEPVPIGSPQAQWNCHGCGAYQFHVAGHTAQPHVAHPEPLSVKVAHECSLKKCGFVPCGMPYSKHDCKGDGSVCGRVACGFGGCHNPVPDKAPSRRSLWQAVFGDKKSDDPVMSEVPPCDGKEKLVREVRGNGIHQAPGYVAGGGDRDDTNLYLQAQIEAEEQLQAEEDAAEDASDEDQEQYLRRISGDKVYQGQRIGQRKGKRGKGKNKRVRREAKEGDLVTIAEVRKKRKKPDPEIQAYKKAYVRKVKTNGQTEKERIFAEEQKIVREAWKAGSKRLACNIHAVGVCKVKSTGDEVHFSRVGGRFYFPLDIFNLDRLDWKKGIEEQWKTEVLELYPPNKRGEMPLAPIEVPLCVKPISTASFRVVRYGSLYHGYFTIPLSGVTGMPADQLKDWREAYDEITVVYKDTAGLGAYTGLQTTMVEAGLLAHDASTTEGCCGALMRDRQGAFAIHAFGGRGQIANVAVAIDQSKELSFNMLVDFEGAAKITGRSLEEAIETAKKLEQTAEQHLKVPVGPGSTGPSPGSLSTSR